MDLSFTEEQEALRRLAREIFDDHTTTERLKEAEAEPGYFDRSLWAELARANVLGAGIGESYGGIGGGIFECCLVLEQAGATVAPVPLRPTLVLGALPIGRFGSDAQKSALLPRVASGEAVLTAALAEPASHDPLTPGTRARWDGDAWRLEGVKASVAAGHLAERVLVPASTDNGVGVFLLDPNAPGVTRELQRGTGGTLAWLELDGPAVSEDDVLVEPGTDPDALPWILDVTLTGLCALQVGHAERALQITAAYLSQREQFGRPLGTFQAVQQRAADCYMDVEAMRWTMWQAAWRISEDLPAAEEVAIAKYWASEGGHRVLAAAQHLHGGIGVDIEYPLHRYTFAAKQVEMTLGGATRQLARLGEIMAGEGVVR